MASDKLVLGFDTSAAHCAAALLYGSEVVAERTEEMKRGQAERLMVLLEELLTQADVAWRDLAAIGVGVGPGNFTGIRISVSAARGLALALEIPAIGVSTFEALAFGQEGTTLAAVRGPADRTYFQVISEDTAGEPVICGPGEFPDCAANAETRLIAFPQSAMMGSQPPLQEVAAHCSLPEAIARIAAARRLSATEPPSPLYLKPADAAPSRYKAPVILDVT